MYQYNTVQRIVKSFTVIILICFNAVCLYFRYAEPMETSSIHLVFIHSSFVLLFVSSLSIFQQEFVI